MHPEDPMHHMSNAKVLGLGWGWEGVAVPGKSLLKLKVPLANFFYFLIFLKYVYYTYTG